MTKLGIWAGSSVADKALFNEGLRRLKDLGVEAIIPKATRDFVFKGESKSRPFIAGPDAKKVQSFIELWNRSDLKDIFVVRGGYGTLRLLPLLDKLPLKKSHNKTLWGFSDVTTLQNYLYQRTGAPWVHSPMLTSASFRSPTRLESEQWRKIFDGGQQIHSLKVLNKGTRAVSSLKGPMLGGNLECFVSLLGTRWEPKPKHKFFLMLEDVNEKAYRIDRLLQQLATAKLMRKCMGVILGHFTDCQNAVEVATLWAKENKILLVGGLKAGHDQPNVGIPMGVAVQFAQKSSSEIILTVPKPHW